MSRMPRGTRKYENIVDGKRIIEEDNLFQNRAKKFGFEYLLNDLFSDVKYTVVNEVLSTENVIYIQRTDGSKVYFSYNDIKNSGQETNRKRMQIYKNYFGLDVNGNIRRPEDDYFFIGLYPTNDQKDPVYVLLDNDGYTLNPQESYSSLWINFDSLWYAYKNKMNYAINRRNGNKYVCFRKERWELLFDSIISKDFSSVIDNNISYVNKNGSIEEKVDEEVEIYDEKRDAFISNNSPKLRKNSNYRDLILHESKYTCSLCNKDVTFKTNANKMYFEAHHLIPCNFNTQKSFNRKLDSPINMYCLCPECHRKIHFINDNEIDDLLIALYDKRKTAYQNNYNLSAEGLIQIYKKIDRQLESLE